MASSAASPFYSKPLQLVFFSILIYQPYENLRRRKPAVSYHSIYIIESLSCISFVQPFRLCKLIQIISAPARFALEHLSALAYIFFSAFFFKPVSYLIARGGSLDHIEPISARAFAACAGHYFYYIRRLQFIIQRNKLTVNLRSYAFISYFSMNAVRKIQRSAAFYQIFYVSLRRIDQYVSGKQVDLQRFHKFAAVLHVVLPFHHLTQPRQFSIKICDFSGSVFIFPMRCNTVFRRSVHIERANLNFKRLAVLADQSRMQRLIHIALRNGDIILESLRQRTPHSVNSA